MQLRGELRSAVQSVRDAMLRRDRGQLQLRAGILLSKMRAKGGAVRPVHHVVRAKQYRCWLRLDQWPAWGHLRAAVQWTSVGDDA